MAFERISVGFRIANPNLLRVRASKYGGALTIGANYLHNMNIKSGESGKMGFGYDPQKKRIYIKKLTSIDENGVVFRHKGNDKQMNKIDVYIPGALTQKLRKDLGVNGESVSFLAKPVETRIDKEVWYELVPLG